MAHALVCGHKKAFIFGRRGARPSEVAFEFVYRAILAFVGEVFALRFREIRMTL
jgi:hypothetical protein